jgi:nucleoside-diphosphate-sugar epimerase
MPPERVRIDHRLQNLKIAITGYRGFIGRFLVAALKKLEVELLLLEGDVRSPDTWSGSFDLLYHLAASMPRRFTDNPVEGFSVNIEGTLRALEASRKRDAHIIVTSTCGVYSPEITGAVSEEGSLNPQSPYAQSKLLAEMLCSSYAQNYEVKSTVLRIFNVYGPGQDRNFIIPYIMQCALDGETAIIHNPQSARDFIYVTDVISALIAASLQGDHFDIFNVGTGKIWTNIQVLEIIERMMEKSISWESKDGRIDNQPIIHAKVEKAAYKLGWLPEIELEQGLRRLLNNMKSRSENIL